MFPNSRMGRNPKKDSRFNPHHLSSPPSSGENISMSKCSYDKVQLICEDSMREIRRLQSNRIQNNIFIITDERDNLDPDLTEFDYEVKVKIIPGMKLRSVFPIIEQNPYFDKGTMWIFMGGIHDVLQTRPLRECLDFNCHPPQVSLTLHPRTFDTSHLVKDSLQLNLDILCNTENDVALFSGLIPVRINHYNFFSRCNRSCLAIHDARPIFVSHNHYNIYANSVTLFNNFARYHATVLGYSPWSLEVSKFGRRVLLVQQLHCNGFDLHPNELRERENRVELLCQELLATFSLNLEERGRAILLQGLNRKITEQILRSYFEVYGQIERTSVRYRSLGEEHKTAYGYILFTSKSSVTSLLTKGSQFVIDGVTLFASRISKEPTAEIQNFQHDLSRLVSQLEDPKLPIPMQIGNPFPYNPNHLETKTRIKTETTKPTNDEPTPHKISPTISTDILSPPTDLDSRIPSEDLEIVYEKILVTSKGYVSIQRIRWTEWCIVWKRDGRFYFHNKITKKSLWEKPSEIEGHPDVDVMIATPPPEVVSLMTLRSIKTEKSTDSDSAIVPSTMTLPRRLSFSELRPNNVEVHNIMGSEDLEETDVIEVLPEQTSSLVRSKPEELELAICNYSMRRKETRSNSVEARNIMGSEDLMETDVVEILPQLAHSNPEELELAIDDNSIRRKETRSNNVEVHNIMGSEDLIETDVVEILPQLAPSLVHSKPDELELVICTNSMRRKSSPVIANSLEEKSLCVAPLEGSSLNTTETLNPENCEELMSISKVDEISTSDTLHQTHDGGSEDPNQDVEHAVDPVELALQLYFESRGVSPN